MELRNAWLLAMTVVQVLSIGLPSQATTGENGSPVPCTVDGYGDDRGTYQRLPVTLNTAHVALVVDTNGFMEAEHKVLSRLIGDLGNSLYNKGYRSVDFSVVVVEGDKDSSPVILEGSDGHSWMHPQAAISKTRSLIQNATAAPRSPTSLLALDNAISVAATRNSAGSRTQNQERILIVFANQLYKYAHPVGNGIFVEFRTRFSLEKNRWRLFAVFRTTLQGDALDAPVINARSLPNASVSSLEMLARAHGGRVFNIMDLTGPSKTMNRFAVVDMIFRHLPREKVTIMGCKHCRCILNVTTCEFADDLDECFCLADAGVGERWHASTRTCYPPDSVPTLPECRQFYKPMPWSPCSLTCGEAFRVRDHLPDDKDNAVTRDHPCSPLTRRTESERCNVGLLCPEQQHNLSCAELATRYGVSSGYGPCSTTCGNNGQSVSYLTVPTRYLRPGQTCGVLGIAGLPCGYGLCPSNLTCDDIHERYGIYGSWSECSVRCGVGVQTRLRGLSQFHRPAGRECPLSMETRQCHVPCPSKDTCEPMESKQHLARARPGRKASIVVVLDGSPSHSFLLFKTRLFVERLVRYLIKDGRGSYSNLQNSVQFVLFCDESTLADRMLPSTVGEYPVGHEATSDAYVAMRNALRRFSGRESTPSANILIFASGHPRQVEDAQLTRAELKRAISEHGYRPHFIVDQDLHCGDEPALGFAMPDYAFTDISGCNSRGSIGCGYASVKRDFSSLAVETRGSVWDINNWTGRSFSRLPYEVEMCVHIADTAHSDTAYCTTCQCRLGSLENCSLDHHRHACPCRAQGWEWIDGRCVPRVTFAARECSVIVRQLSSVITVVPCTATCGGGVVLSRRELPLRVRQERPNCIMELKRGLIPSRCNEQPCPT